MVGRGALGACLVFAAGVLAACGSKAEPECQHPCDLFQTFYVELEGNLPASIKASGACNSEYKCTTKESCSRLMFYLTNGGPAWEGPDAADMVCHLTAVSISGQTVERDVRATYTPGYCCAGWEFGVNSPVKIVFEPSDASAD